MFKTIIRSSLGSTLIHECPTLSTTSIRNGTRNGGCGSSITSPSSYKLQIQSIRAYKHKYTAVRTFLSDKDRVRSFVTMLDPEERKLLLDELIRQDDGLTIISDSTSKDQGQPNQHEHRPTEPPTFAELEALAIHQSLPFIGFGFLDNLIMIIAGDYIDLTLGVTFGISTMAAAGLGNALSDVAGVGSAFYVERIADRVGVKPPKLNLEQLQMPKTRWATQIGRAIGVTIGCIIGMFPLLFIPHKEDLKPEISVSENEILTE